MSVSCFFVCVCIILIKFLPCIITGVSWKLTRLFSSFIAVFFFRRIIVFDISVAISVTSLISFISLVSGKKFYDTIIMYSMEFKK